MDGLRIQFNYLNHNGKLSRRDISIDAIEFHYLPGYGYQPGWFISGFDYDKQAQRSFALDHIQLDKHPSLVNETNRVTRLLAFASAGEPKLGD